MYLCCFGIHICFHLLLASILWLNSQGRLRHCCFHMIEGMVRFIDWLSVKPSAVLSFAGTSTSQHLLSDYVATKCMYTSANRK